MQEITHALKAVIQELFTLDVEPELTRPDEQFGDYATNVALQLAKRLGKSPRDVATELTDGLRERVGDHIKDISIAGPGFINLTLSDVAVLQLAQHSIGGHTHALQGKVVVIETNNPNPFKDLHIGHASNSIVADTVANLIEAGGAQLHRVSYHGDVGLHVGKSMWAILQFVDGDPAKLQEIAETERSKFLSKKYAEGAAAYEEDESAKQEIEALAKESFTLANAVYKEVYDTCKAWSFTYFDQVFSSIGSHPIEHRYLERETDEAGRKTVESHIGTVFERSDGAVVFKGEKYGLHTRVFISSRGTTLYEARDLGLMQLKNADFHPDASYIVTAVEQQEYFKVVLKAAELCLPELGNQTHNISTGMVKLSTGKMSSRSGTAINIGWLFDELEKALKERGAQSDTLQDGVIGALRYTMLKNRIGGDTIFDVTEAISLEGNSGPYLQYAHARARSILGKASQTEAAIAGLETDERSLIRKIGEYPEVVEKAVRDLMPHHICGYLYELAQTFNRFYEHNRVIDDPRQAIRLQLVELYAGVLRDGLTLLGIPAPERI